VQQRPARPQPAVRPQRALSDGNTICSPDAHYFISDCQHCTRHCIFGIMTIILMYNYLLLTTYLQLIILQGMVL